MNKKKLPNLIVIFILSAITALFWVSTTIYTSVVKTVPVPVPEEVVSPITPNLDTQTLELMKNKIYP